MTERTIRSLALLFSICCLCSGTLGRSQSAQDAPQTSHEITHETVAQALDAIDGADDLPAETADAIRAVYDEAKQLINRRNDARARAAASRQSASDAPSQLAAIRAELATPVDSASPEVPANATLSQLEQQQSLVAAELSTARRRADELQAEITRRRDRRSEIPAQLAALRQERSDLVASAGPTVEGVAPALLDARRQLRDVTLAALDAEIDAFDAELSSIEARRDLLPARRDQVSRRVAQNEGVAQAWQQIVSDARQRQAERVAQEAESSQRDAARRHPVLKEYADQTQALAENRAGPDGVLAGISESEQQTAAARATLDQLRQEYTETRRRIDISGFNRATGRALRRQFESLPTLLNLVGLRRQLAETQRRTDQAEIALLDRQDQRQATGDIETVASSLMQAVQASEQPVNPESAKGLDLERAARDLAVRRRDLLDELITDLSKYVDITLLEQLSVTSELITAGESYEDFIRERILWVRSIALNQRIAASHYTDGFGWIISPTAWKTAFGLVRTELASRWPTAMMMGALVLLGFVARSRALSRIRARAELVRRYATDEFAYTIEVACLTLVASFPVSAMLWGFGWLLTQPAGQVPPALAVAAGLQAGAFLLFPLQVLRRTLKPDGLADAHFRWHTDTIRTVRRNLHWFAPIAVPSLILVVAFGKHPDDAITASIGRVAFTVSMLTLALFIQRVLRPGGPALAEFMRRNKGGWLDRLRFLWYPALIGLPLGLTVASWLGYYYTARQLDTRLGLTLLMVMALTLFNGILMRWLFVARRRAAVEDARRRRAQSLADAARDENESDIPSEAAVAQVDEDKVDLPAMSAQTRQLFLTAIAVTTLIGLYGIWSDVLPALRMLDRVQVWPEQRLIEAGVEDEIPALEGTLLRQESSLTSAPPEAAPTTEQAPNDPALSAAPGAGASPDDGAPDLDPLAITLADLGLALVILIATTVAFRNLPGLVEIIVLQRLPLDAGSRYAMATVLRYAIAMAGTALAFSALGLSWERVQWLAAALTFGLAFGLQEIFANFICGLIILAERPIRIGDTVTVAGVSGSVTRIRMRATTITDWDRKELVIPNKAFITDQVINWTLSDPMLRLAVPVGVSYDSDARQVERLLMQIATDQGIVLQEPKPYVLFNGFGDSTLDFQLRVFLAHSDDVLKVKHDLHMRILETFRSHDIEIAFPQRDVHLRSTVDLREFLVPPGEA